MMRFLSFLLSFCLMAAVGLVFAGTAVYWYFSKDLPNHRQLAEYRPSVISRVYAGHGELIGEFAKERRLFTPIADMPVLLRSAFVAAEDQNFYTHPGVDLMGVLRAMASNAANIGSGRRMQGASTITQQVMKNFLLSNERRFERKIKEAILAMRFEKTFTKDHILELYLNEIFLGVGTYGVTAAAQTYFGKSLDQLSIAEMAYLAALPKGPNNYHPKRYYDKAITRRNYVINRMYEDGYITLDQKNEAQKEQLVSVLGRKNTTLDAFYYNEEIRRHLLNEYGETVLYNAGLTITASIDTRLQRYAEQALRNALIQLDKKWGWRGALMRGVDTSNPEQAMENFYTPRDLYEWDIALVTKIAPNEQSADIYVKEEKKSATIALSDMIWALKGSSPKQISQIIKTGDVIYVKKQSAQTYELCQIPQVNGAFMVMDPHTGRVLAQQGGFTFSGSQFNRATQAHRQPGSSFKTFIYAAALERGFTPETLVNDGPFYYRDGLGRLWSPKNYDETYLGNAPMRIGMEKSRNLMTIRIAQDIGMRNVLSFAKRFGVADKMKAYLPMALGAGEVTLEQMVTAYASFANGGKKVTPVYYDRIQDRNGRTIMTAPLHTCSTCTDVALQQNQPESDYIIDTDTNNKIVSMLEGVVLRGTGRGLLPLEIPVAGKTGTTNESKDVWFLGFTSNLVFGTYVGFDNPRPMGKLATGGGTAVPIVKEFLAEAKKDYHFEPFRVSKGRFAKYYQKFNADGTPISIDEAAKPENADSVSDPVADIIEKSPLASRQPAPVSAQKHVLKLPESPKQEQKQDAPQVKPVPQPIPSSVVSPVAVTPKPVQPIIPRPVNPVAVQPQPQSQPQSQPVPVNPVRVNPAPPMVQPQSVSAPAPVPMQPKQEFVPVPVDDAGNVGIGELY